MQLTPYTAFIVLLQIFSILYFKINLINFLSLSLFPDLSDEESDEEIENEDVDENDLEEENDEKLDDENEEFEELDDNLDNMDEEVFIGNRKNDQYADAEVLTLKMIKTWKDAMTQVRFRILFFYPPQKKDI